MICVSIGRTRHKMLLAEIHEAAKQGAQMIELRLDFIPRALDFHRILEYKPCPFVATLRRQQDGGRFAGKEEQRLMLMRQIIASGQFEWIDLETDVADQIRRFGKTKRIISYHNLKEMPTDLERIFVKMINQDPDVVKIAVRAEHPLDNLRVMELSQKTKVPTVAFCLGDMGVPSRILAGKFGAPFSYAAFNKERGIAPGILSYDEMKHVYHYDQINSATQVFAVIGDPVAQSLSPLVHNVAFRKLGMNAVYVPIRVPRPDLESTLDGMKRLPIHGYSVTIPHKETVVEMASDREGLVQACKSANTLIPNVEKSFTAYNTDSEAAIQALQEGMAGMVGAGNLAGRTILILGAGGTARTLAYALHRRGALLYISNRTDNKAQHLAEEIGCRYCDWTARNAVVAEIFINCTPVGMHPNVDESPLHPSVFKPGIVVMDVVYHPETTLLIRQARERGCRTITGVSMFIHQAARQFQLFTNCEPPVQDMTAALRRALSPLTVAEHEPEPV